MSRVSAATRIHRAATQLRSAVEEDAGLGLELSKARCKTLLRMADQMEELVVAQQEEMEAERIAAEAEEAAAKSETIAEIRREMEERGITLTDLRAGGARPPSSPPSAPGKKKHTRSSAIRHWAAENGYVVNRLGIIPTDIQNAYDEAMAS